MKNEQQKANRKLTWQLWLFAAGFLAFGFALVPLYNVLCDVTGYGDRTKLRQASKVVEASDQISPSPGEPQTARAWDVYSQGRQSPVLIYRSAE